MSIGENGIFSKAKYAKEKYAVEQIREKVELEIANLEIERINLKQTLTIEEALQEMVENKTFESIDKEEQIGNIGEYEVKLKYNENNKIVIEYVKRATGVRITYTLNPVGYTNEEKLSILLKVQGKAKSITKPDGSVIYPENTVETINYEVTANGTYTFIIEDEEGNKKEKNVIIDTIDKLAPKNFEVTAENTGTGLIITANTEDEEPDGTSVKSGIERYEYFVKKESETEYIKYDTNEIENLEVGNYNIYVIAYDRAENSTQTTTITVQVKQIIKFSKISAGGDYNLAIDSEGKLWAWGYNCYGQLGNGTTTNSNVPIQIKEGMKFKQISAGWHHSLAIDSEGNLWTWGINDHGQLGDGTKQNIKASPIQIKEGTKFSQISAGMNHSLAIDSEGKLWAWGWNNNGQLGDGTTTDKTSPVQIKQGTTFNQISSIQGKYSLAIDSEGKLWAWGDNTYGQLGDGTTTNKTSPVQIKEGTTFKKVAAGRIHSLAIDSEGSLWTWGYNYYGQLGNGTKIDKTSPIQIKSETKFNQILGGAFHSLAIDSEGKLWAWGWNNNGQLGDGTTTDKTSPVQIKEGTTFTKIAVGEYHSMAIDSEGNLWAWGSNNCGQFGDGTTTNSLVPKEI